MKQLKTSYPIIAYVDSRVGGRRENQDSCAWGDTPAGFLVTVCDGMGGGPSGKEASTIAVNGLLKYIQENADCKCDRVDLMRRAVEYANSAIISAVIADSSKKGMGTTLTAILINDYSAVVAHVGDSRVYQFRSGRKHYRTNDHSLVFLKIKEKEIKTEEEARLHPDSNIILRALGISKTVKPSIVELAYEKGDRFMLCTDGIWGMFPEKVVISIAAKTQVLSGAVESMVVKVDEEGFATGGTHDNLTIAMLETRNNSLMRETMSTVQRNSFIILAVLCSLSLLLNIFLLTRNGPNSTRSSTQSKVDSLSLVVRGLSEELQETQSRLKQSEDSHAAFVKKIQSEKDPGELKRITSKADMDVSLRLELEGIMKDIKKLGDLKKGVEKKKMLEDVTKRFSDFADKAGESIVDTKTKEEVLTYLKNPVAKQDDARDPQQKVKGHYSIIWKKLNTIFNKI